MYQSPLTFLGPVRGKRILVCEVGAEVLGFAMAGADVYGFAASDTQVQVIKDLARSLGLRDQTHLQTMALDQLAYPDDFFDLLFGKSPAEHGNLECGARELARVLKRGGRAAFIGDTNDPARELMRRAFGEPVLGRSWIGAEKGLLD
jgi:SAM-dependent methyltransferase